MDDWRLVTDWWRWYKSLVHPSAMHGSEGAWDSLVVSAADFLRDHPGDFAVSLVGAAIDEIERRAEQ